MINNFPAATHGKARQKATPTKSPRAINRQETNNGESKRSVQSPNKRESLPFLRIKSTIFHSLYFYFDKEDYASKDGHKYKTIVFENSGKIFERLPSVNSKDQDKEIFCVFKDSPEFIKKKKNCENHNSNLKLNFISHRWIDHCITCNSVLRDIFKSKMIHLLPLACTTPLIDFQDKSFYVTGYDKNEEFILENLLRILGSKVLLDK